jgi:magnesium-transporting ATPase (P-type)
MITGDHANTALTIGRNLGIATTSTQVLDSSKINQLAENESIKKFKVFSRIMPADKFHILSLLKQDNIVAMTGDGVNDAPALKKADIGVAMGIMGTDVSKEAADMILLDDNFFSIVRGVKKGRTIYQNLKKFVHYVFTSNAGELFTVVFGVILQIPAPISAIQILAVDLGTDIFPSFALGLEPEEPNSQKKISDKKTSQKLKNVLGWKEFRRIVYLGIIMSIGATIAFIWSMKRGGWIFGHSISTDSLLYIKSTTAAYAVLVLCQIANLLQSRSEFFSPFKLGFFKNIYAIGSIFISLGMFLGFMYFPFFQKYLHMLPIEKCDWLVAIAAGLVLFTWEEFRKKRNN